MSEYRMESTIFSTSGHVTSSEASRAWDMQEEQRGERQSEDEHPGEPVGSPTCSVQAAAGR